jgi:hypothetical protein
MITKYPIKLKAIFLLLVFSCNTLVGFACAAGIDMGFNSKHHHHPNDFEVASAPKVIPTDDNIHHHHDEEINKNKKSSDDNCCDKGVMEFSQLDKLLSQVQNLEISSPPTIIIAHHHYNLSDIATTEKNQKQIQTVRRCFPNAPDIRVSIQSFQI